MGRVFRAVLTDNGTEFSDERAIADLVGEGPGETRLFYCDPRRSDQKGACERNHVEIRKLLPKGSGLRFDRLAPADLALAMSHVNSEPRGALRFSTPAPPFRALLGDAAAALRTLAAPRAQAGGTARLDLTLAGTTAEQVAAGIAGYYKDAATVKVHALNEALPENGLYSNAMAGTDRMELYMTVNAAGDQMMLVSLFDNLGKGSSGAAVQCMNLMLGFEETAGLE